MGHRRSPAPTPHSQKGRRAQRGSHPACVRTQQLALPRSWALLIHCHEVTTHKPTGRAAQRSPSSPSVLARLQWDWAEPSLAPQALHRPDTLPWKQPELPAGGGQPPFRAGCWDGEHGYRGVSFLCRRSDGAERPGVGTVPREVALLPPIGVLGPAPQGRSCFLCTEPGYTVFNPSP